MSSRLLNVLNKIESDRQLVINRARLAGYNPPQNCSISYFASLIQDIEEPSTFFNPGIPQDLIYTEEWVRPTEWPDTKTILYDTPTDNYRDPYLLVLLKTDAESTVIPKSQGLSTSTNGQTCIGWGMVKTSDGVTYTTNSADITHTWDTSKDIVIESGDYAGRYRYIIYYTGSGNNVAESTRSVAYNDMVEVVGITPRRASSYRLTFPTFFFNQNNLLNIDYSDTSEYNSTVTLPTYNSNPYTSAFNDLRSLKNITISNDYNKISLAYSGNTPSLFRNCHHLRHLDLSNLTYTFSGSTTCNFNLRGCFSLVSFKSPIFKQSSQQSIAYTPGFQLGYHPLLEEFEVTLASPYTENSRCVMDFPISSYSSYSGTYIPKTCRFTGNFASTLLPYNWKGHSYFGNVMFNGAIYGATNTPPTDIFNLANVTREVVDLSNMEGFTYQSLAQSVLNPSSPNSYWSAMSYTAYDTGMLYQFSGSLLLPNDTVTRMDLTNMCLTRESFMQMVSALKDISEEQVTYNPTIKLHWYTKSKLLPEDIQLINSKGWGVQ